MNVVITIHDSGDITCDHTLEEIEKTYMDGGEISAWIVEPSFPAEASMYRIGGIVQYAICFPLESPSAQRYFVFDFTASGYGVVACQQLGTGGSWGEEHWVYMIPDLEKITTTNKTVPTSAWSSDSTYTDLGFNYRASVSVSRVTDDYIPDVNFSPADQYSGNLASFADTYNGGVYIYAKTQPTETVTIESAIFTRS